MGTEPPHVVKGVEDSLAKAESLLRSLGADQSQYEIYGPFGPPTPPYPNRFEPVDHDPGTESVKCRAKSGDTGARDPLHAAEMELHVRWTTGDSTIYTIRHDADAVFLTRFGREAFMYPRYHFLFGAGYVEMLRQRLRDPE